MSSPSLNVIALISGGKDSFYSILHCQHHGHTIVALANLYPPAQAADSTDTDLNSFMYQTVGHTVVPLYEQALGIPLYRQEIRGTAVVDGLTYHPLVKDAADAGVVHVDPVEDETESLVPLLQSVLKAHPHANAICTGAILSTYQRTRVEAVATRLGLVSLAYLWKYPVLPPARQPAGLLEDMRAAKLEARIVKVASAGLDEGSLWQDVLDPAVTTRIQTRMQRFGNGSDGSVLGEGGEFETLVLDGPRSLFKHGRIEVRQEHRRVVREDAGVAWLSINEARIECSMDLCTPEPVAIWTPSLLDHRSEDMLAGLLEQWPHEDICERRSPGRKETIWPRSMDAGISSEPVTDRYGCCIAAFAPSGEPAGIDSQIAQLCHRIEQFMPLHKFQSTDVVASTILLRNMSDFATVNMMYAKLFPRPNPPARVTVECGPLLPQHVNVVLYLRVHAAPTLAHKRALHVQSRSYWAPANIGPYSQAVSITPQARSQSSTGELDAAPVPIEKVFIAGQIPLIPHLMELPDMRHEVLVEAMPHAARLAPSERHFALQTVLALQHLCRVGREMGVKWWPGAVAYVPRESGMSCQARAVLVGRAWTLLHARRARDHEHGISLDEDEDSDEQDEQADVWFQRHDASQRRYAGTGTASDDDGLPAWSVVDDASRDVPLCFAVEVAALPRASQVEWHAMPGLTRGPIKILTRRSHAEPGWVVQQHVVDNQAVYTVIAIADVPEADADYEEADDAYDTEDAKDAPHDPERKSTTPDATDPISDPATAAITAALAAALTSIGYDAQPQGQSQQTPPRATTTYIDVTRQRLDPTLLAWAGPAVVPASSIYGARGERWCAVYVFEDGPSVMDMR